jgi:hypothetical protein
MNNIGPFVLIGIDAEGDTRESHHASLEEAVALGRACSAPDENGPPWQSWEVWGNHPDTEAWVALATSAEARKEV